MLDQTLTLPEDPEELRSFTARLLAEVKAQAILIEKLRHQLAGYRAHRFGASSEAAEQLQLALETSEIAAAAMTARMKLPDIEEKDKPKRRPIPDHIPSHGWKWNSALRPMPVPIVAAACVGSAKTSPRNSSMSPGASS
ncbi:hypothetical protein [Pseudotabrizicola algicola]|uniref:Transposase TnpC homeodomain domain-containing protein n=1 Tax=Pseudotabrizicola algicola TaxID=2709381 RepID=A0A6B3RS33_9RHOB|nr:hypothetical protein [Pseudotabrizicola algicola]NEX47956.1 hypothetical protein [Pseudotabrizicola algicola]